MPTKDDDKKAKDNNASNMKKNELAEKNRKAGKLKRTATRRDAIRISLHVKSKNKLSRTSD